MTRSCACLEDLALISAPLEDQEVAVPRLCRNSNVEATSTIEHDEIRENVRIEPIESDDDTGTFTQHRMTL
jgi:hypothetical protein